MPPFELTERVKLVALAESMQRSLRLGDFRVVNAELDHEHVAKTLLAHFHETQAFVVEGEQSSTMLDAKKSADELKEALATIDLPFRTCSFEIKGWAAIGDLGLTGHRGKSLCLWVHEVTPRVYYLASLEYIHGREAVLLGEARQRSATPGKTRLLTATMSRKLRHMKLGTDTSRPSVVVGTGKNRVRTKVGNVIYACLPETPAGRVASLCSGAIDWDRLWALNGYWLPVEGQGKDRGGNPGVEGYTWVLPET